MAYGIIGALSLCALLGAAYIVLTKRRVDRRSFEQKCKRKRADGPTPCLMCPGECVGEPVSRVTPICPECGKVDHARPFFRGALGCLREDCGKLCSTCHQPGCKD